jgi:hypothetical protein
LRELQTTIADNVNKQITIAKLKDMMDNGNYADITKAVSFNAESQKKKTYTPAALFLILESMAGTWRLHLDNEKTPKNQRSLAYDLKQQLVLRQVVYDITMWNSIANRPIHTRYHSHLVKEFIDNFKLVHSEPETELQPSSDEDLDGDAAALNSASIRRAAHAAINANPDPDEDEEFEIPPAHEAGASPQVDAPPAAHSQAQPDANDTRRRRRAERKQREEAAAATFHSEFTDPADM